LDFIGTEVFQTSMGDVVLGRERSAYDLIEWSNENLSGPRAKYEGNYLLVTGARELVRSGRRSELKVLWAWVKANRRSSIAARCRFAFMLIVPTGLMQRARRLRASVGR
jgi:hypothetical protein